MPRSGNFVCEILRDERWHVCGEATNGREAVDMALKLRPDAVILDLSMPELSGLDAARQILKTMPETTILILTLHEGEDMTRAALQAGACACVLKTDLKALVGRLREKDMGDGSI